MSVTTFTASGLKRISLNTVWLLLARLASQGLMFLLGVLVARRLGEAGLGRFAFITAVVFIGNVFTTFGMDTYLMRHIAQKRETRSAPLAVALVLQMGWSLLFIMAVWATAVWLSKGNVETSRALQLYVLALLPLAFSTIFSAALRAYERMGLYFAVSLLTAVFQTSAATFYLRQGGNLTGLLAWLLLGQFAAAALAGLLCQAALPDFNINWRLVNWNQLRQTARFGVVLALLMGLSVLYQRLGIFLLAALASEAEIGWFSAALRLVDAVKIIPFAFFGALFPVMARQAGQMRQRWYGTAVVGLMGLMLLAIVAFYGLAAPLISWLYGASYEPAVPALTILAWSLLPFVLSLHFSFELVAAGKEKQTLLVTAVALALTTLIGLISYAQAGLYGICWAIVIGEMIQAGLFIIIVYDGRGGMIGHDLCQKRDRISQLSHPPEVEGETTRKT